MISTETISMKYVLGFPIKNDHLLLLKRARDPWMNKWNGAGGKIESDETPRQAYYREMREETTLDLQQSETRYAGIVTWEFDDREEVAGMYVYLSELADHQKMWKEERQIREGILAWKEIAWACDKKTQEIADNIPHFLPLMKESKTPQQYHCLFIHKVFTGVQVFPLPPKMTIA